MQTNPYDALRHAILLYTKVDAQCNKLATVVGRIKLTILRTLLTVCVPYGELFLTPVSETKLKRRVRLLFGYAWIYALQQIFSET